LLAHLLFSLVLSLPLASYLHNYINLSFFLSLKFYTQQSDYEPTMGPKPRIVPRVPPKPGQTTFDKYAVESFLVAFGDDDQPLPDTVKVLDEIVTE
jgi:hypothetical protein